MECQKKLLRDCSCTCCRIFTGLSDPSHLLVCDESKVFDFSVIVSPLSILISLQVSSSEFAIVMFVRAFVTYLVDRSFV